MLNPESLKQELNVGLTLGESQESQGLSGLLGLVSTAFKLSGA